MQQQVAAAKALRYAEHHMRFPLAVVCVYEAFSIFTRRTPTITELCANHSWVAPLVGAVVTWHISYAPKKEVKI